MRELLKALPLGLGLPVIIGAASVKPEDAASNLAAWAKLLGIRHVPEWLSNPAIDEKAITWSLVAGALYAFAVWGIPAIKRRRLKQLAAHSAPSAWSNDSKETIIQSAFEVNGKQVTGRWFGNKVILDQPFRIMTARSHDRADKLTVTIGIGEPNALGRFKYKATENNRFAIFSTVNSFYFPVPAGEGEFHAIISVGAQIGIETKAAQSGWLELYLLGWERPGRMTS